MFFSKYDMIQLLPRKERFSMNDQDKKRLMEDIMIEVTDLLEKKIRKDPDAAVPIISAFSAVVVKSYEIMLGSKDAALLYYHVADQLATQAPPQIKIPKFKKPA